MRRVTDIAGWVTSLAWSEDGLITCGDGKALLWRDTQSTLLANDASSVVSLPSGRAAIGHRSGRVTVTDDEPVSGKVVTSPEAHGVRSAASIGPVHSLAADATGKFVAGVTGPSGNDLTVWRDGKPRWTTHACHMQVCSVAIGADERVYSGGGRDRSIAVWDLHTGLLIDRFTSPGKEVVALVLSPDARRWVSCADCDQWRLWDADDPNPRRLSSPRFGVCALPTPDGDGVLVTDRTSLLRYDWTGTGLGRVAFPPASCMVWGVYGDLWAITHSRTPAGSYRSHLWHGSWQHLQAALNEDDQPPG